MARSQKDDPRFGDMQHHAWNYRPDSVENCAAGTMNERNPPPLLSNSAEMSDNLYVSPNSFAANDVYLSKHPYTMNPQPGDNALKDENMSLNNMQNVNRQNNHQNYAVLNLGNGQLVRVYYDENNQRLMIPVTNPPVNQYELFNNNQGLRDMPLQSQPLSHMFTLNQEYAVNDNNNVHMAQPTTASSSTVFGNDNLNNPSNVPTSNFLREVLGNWEPTSSGTYSPFGQNYPLNHPDAPAINMNPNNPPVLDTQFQTNVINSTKSENSSPKRSDPLADTSNKKRIVAEVKPMRPSYSDVLAKNAKCNSPSENTRKTKVSNNPEAKVTNKTNNSKSEKPSANIKHINDENKQKNENKKLNMTSSGSESGDVNTDDVEKRQKPNKKSKNKRNSNMSRKWSSLDDITKEEESYDHGENDSQFVYIENNSEKPKKDKKFNERKHKISEKSAAADDEFKLDDDDDTSEFLFQESSTDGLKARKKKDRSYGHKAAKPSQDKKKTVQSKWRRNKPGYLGLAQNYLEHWGGATWKAIVWFLYLLSDICCMSGHLSFDLCTSVFTQSYVSSQAVWRSAKDWVRKLGDNKYLLYIDRKLGHTRLGFWRRMKWFKKEAETDGGGDSTKLNANIPLPATGEEAMKRLLACKGKDPYSILGVHVSCTDEEIKRYYRRQAFLVHPDKNQYPGAEEAFKILQHAFDLIGEPERREAYDRRALESRHVEAAWSELSQLLAQLHDKMEFAANTIRCTNCGRRHKRVLTDRPCYAARYCAMCKIRHSAKEGDIWAESSMLGLLVMYYACMDGAVYQITQWASCQKKNLRQLRPDCHLVQYRIVLGNKAQANLDTRRDCVHDSNLEEFLNNLYNKGVNTPSGGGPTNTKQPTADASDAKKRRNKKPKA